MNVKTSEKRIAQVKSIFCVQTFQWLCLLTNLDLANNELLISLCFCRRLNSTDSYFRYNKFRFQLSDCCSASFYILINMEKETKQNQNQNQNKTKRRKRRRQQ